MLNDQTKPHLFFGLITLPLLLFLSSTASWAGDGDLKWAFPTGNNVFSSPAIDSDGTVYVGSYDNNLYAINPDGTQKWLFHTGGSVSSSPVVGSDSTIYVGSDDSNLYAIEGSSGGLADTPWPMFRHDVKHTGRASEFAHSGTIYVDDDNTIGPWLGTQTDPYQYIQDGIDVAANGDTVLVLDGTYIGARNKNLDFAGNAITVTSQNGPASTIIDCEGNGRGFYFHSQENVDSVVNGFTIQNGQAEPSGVIGISGGGIYCYDYSSPTISNNNISNNSAVYGAGIYCGWHSSPKIISNVITGNSAERDGGGIGFAWASPTIKDNTIDRNIGFGIYSGYYSVPEITNNSITENAGEGIYCYHSSAKIANNTIARNEGGGVHCYSSSPTIMNNTIMDNLDAAGAGGIHCGCFCISPRKGTLRD